MEERNYRDRTIAVLLHEDEYEHVHELAHVARKSKSAWVRDAILREVERQRRRLGRAETAA